MGAYHERSGSGRKWWGGGGDVVRLRRAGHEDGRAATPGLHAGDAAGGIDSRIFGPCTWKNRESSGDVQHCPAARCGRLAAAEQWRSEQAAEGQRLRNVVGIPKKKQARGSTMPMRDRRS